MGTGWKIAIGGVAAVALLLVVVRAREVAAQAGPDAPQNRPRP